MAYREISRSRILLAQECARLMAEDGITDFRTAKRKAAQRLAISSKSLLPDNQEIEQALINYQRLFQADRQPQHLRYLREAALEAMHFLAIFRPKLVGAVLNGTAGPNTSVQLHLFVDTPKEVALFLMEQRIPFETGERRLKASNGNLLCLPVFRFGAGDHDFDLTVFLPTDEREAPRSPVDGRPMRRAGLAEVQALLSEY